MTKRANPPPLTRALVQDNVPAKVMDRLWIGSIHAAFNQDSMQDRGITHVLNASGLPATFPRQFTYFTVDVRDKENTNILGAIGAVNIFIEAGVEKGGVLVHCAGGRSRSVAFVVAFIMSTQECSYDHAYAQVRRARPVASVNRGFEQQLRAYGATQCDVFAAHQMMLRVKAAMMYERRLLVLQRASKAGGGGAAGGGGRGDTVAASNREEKEQQQQQQQQQLPPPTPSQQQVMLTSNASSTSSGGGGGSVNITMGGGMPPTPRSPRGRGRSGPQVSAGGDGNSSSSSSTSSHWQRKGGGGVGGGSSSTNSGGATAGSGGNSTAGGGGGGGSGGSGASGFKGRDELQFLAKEPRPTRFRLCRPGSASIQVIPPLKSLERIYACRSCGCFLFTGGHVIKINIDLPSINTILAHTSPGSPAHERHLSPEGAATPPSTTSASAVAVVTTLSSSTPSPKTTPPPRTTPPPIVHGPATIGTPPQAGTMLLPHPTYGLLSGSGDRISTTPPPPPLPPPDQLFEEAKYAASSTTTTSLSASRWKRPGSALENGALVIGGAGLSGEFQLERPPAHLGRWPSVPPEDAASPDPAMTRGRSAGGDADAGATLVTSRRMEQGEFQLERPPAHLGRWPEVIPGKNAVGMVGLLGTASSSSSVCERGERGGRGGSSYRTAPPSSAPDSVVSTHARSTATGFRFQSPLAFVPPACPSRPGGAAGGGGGGGAGNSNNWNRGKPAFGFDSEDDCSSVDALEQLEGSKFVDPGWRNSSGNPSASARAGRGELGGLVLQTQTRGEWGLRGGIDGASPDRDRLMTPRSPSTPAASVASASPAASESSTLSGRRLSAEKRQFLMKMHMLESSGSTIASSAQSSSNKSLLATDSAKSSLADPSSSNKSLLTDQDLSERLSSKIGRWIYVDWLEWMGDIMGAPAGRISCPSSGCGVELGSWSWERSSDPMRAPTGPPLIVMEKTTVKATSYILSHYDSRNSLSRDNTPRSSPTSAKRIEAASKASPPESGAGGSSVNRRSSGILESKLAALAPQQQKQAQSQRQKQQPRQRQQQFQQAERKEREPAPPGEGRGGGFSRSLEQQGRQQPCRGSSSSSVNNEDGSQAGRRSSHRS